MPQESFTKEEASEVIKRYCEKYDITPIQAIHSISYFCQNGGYVKSVPDKSVTINSKTKLETLNSLREVVSSVRKKGTVRQLARTLVKQIHQMSTKMSYKGHLYNTLSLKKEISAQDSIYCCEYYLDFELTPIHIKELLKERVLEREGKNQTKKSKPKKRK